MPWCPECKYEYVEGIKICPDCKKALVDSLDDIVEEVEIEIEEEVDIFSTDGVDSQDEEEGGPIRIDIMEMIQKVQSGEMSSDEFNEIINNLRQQASRNKEYRYIKDSYEENKSSVLVLLVCGILGIAVLVLNALGVFHLPFRGFSLILTNVVMGGLFFIFILSGIRSFIKAKKLKPLVSEEADLIEKCVEFLKNQKAGGAFVLNEELSFEEESLVLSNLCVEALEQNFDNLEDGFAFFVTDRYFSEIFDDTTTLE